MIGKLTLVVAGSALLTAAADTPPGADRAGWTDPAFAPMAPIELPIFANGRIDGRIDLTLVWHARDKAAADVVTKEMRTLRADTLSALTEFNRLYATGLTPIDTRRLSAWLNDPARALSSRDRRVLIVRLSSTPD